jgi:hypothetical protein
LRAKQNGGLEADSISIPQQGWLQGVTDDGQSKKRPSRFSDAIPCLFSAHGLWQAGQAASPFLLSPRESPLLIRPATLQNIVAALPGTPYMKVLGGTSRIATELALIFDFAPTFLYSRTLA